MVFQGEKKLGGFGTGTPSAFSLLVSLWSSENHSSSHLCTHVGS